MQQCERIARAGDILDPGGVSEGAGSTGGNPQQRFAADVTHPSPPVALVVDDDPTARRLVMKALNKSGMATLEASSGSRALELYDACRPDIILLDVVMPGMDGFTTCRAIREKPDGRGPVPIVMVTGADDLDSINRAYEAGATDFFTKPINWLILTQKVRYLLRANRAMMELQASRTQLTTAQRIARLGNWELDVRTGCLECSDEILRLFELDPSRFTGSCQDLSSRLGSEDADALKSLLDQAILTGKAFRLDHTITLKDGCRRSLSQQVETVCHSENGQVVRLLGIVQDISERMRRELFESDRNRVLEMIIRSHPIQETLAAVTELVARQQPRMGCALSLLRDGRLDLLASSGITGPLLESIRSLQSGPGRCGAAAAAYYGQTMIAPDIGGSSSWSSLRHAALESGIRADCSMPFFSGMGSVLGAVSLMSPHPWQPDRSDLEMLEAVCKLVSVALEQKDLSDRLNHQASHDALTGLPNRASFNALSRLFLHASSSSQPERLAVMFLDLDRFKHVNDSLGHAAGDQLLKEVAERVKRCIRDSDTLIRMGGDELMILYKNVQDRTMISRIALRVRETLNEPFRLSGHEVHVGVSIGISVFPEDGMDLEMLQKNADIAMYRAKNQGGNQHVFFESSMSTLLLERLEIENEMRKAIERSELELYFQPQFRMGRLELCGVEALLRWTHPTLGRIPPTKFIPVAEASGLIVPIGKWVLVEACRQNLEWQRQGFPPFPVSVNVSAIELMQHDFLESLEEALTRSRLEPRWLQLEITEGVLLNNLEAAVERLKAIRSLGVSIAIDDFGVGYSSMSYVHRLPIDCLKIDKSFVRELEGTEELVRRSRALIEAMVTLARNLGLQIIAEGVECASQQAVLGAIGCPVGQGFLFREPVPATDISSLCREMLASPPDEPP